MSVYSKQANQPSGEMKMDDEAKIRICHAVLKGSDFKSIADAQGTTAAKVKDAWGDIAGRLENPPCNPANIRDCLFYRGHWLRFISTLG